jgi:hypothetical protein
MSNSELSDAFKNVRQSVSHVQDNPGKEMTKEMSIVVLILLAAVALFRGVLHGSTTTRQRYREPKGS